MSPACESFSKIKVSLNSVFILFWFLVEFQFQSLKLWKYFKVALGLENVSFVSLSWESLCAHVGVHAVAWVWWLDDSFKEWFFSSTICVLGIKRGSLVWWLVPLPIESSFQSRIHLALCTIACADWDGTIELVWGVE